MTKEQVPNDKIGEEIGKETTRNPRYVVQWGCVVGKLKCIIEESSNMKRNMKGLIRACVCEGVGVWGVGLVP